MHHDRVSAVLAGRQPNHPPVSFWHHFSSDEVFGPSALRAHLAHVEQFDLDFLKVMNDNPYPDERRVERVGDLARLTVLDGNEAGFARQLDLLADLKRALGGRVPMTTTIFNAWSVLRRMVDEPATGRRPPDLDAEADARSRTLREYIIQDRAVVATAIQTISASLANFALRCLAAGADGIYLSVRDDWVRVDDSDRRRYADLVRPGDLKILAACNAATFNVLHVCGRPIDFRMFAEYPVHALSWADRAAGPEIAEVASWIKPAICAGVHNLSTLPNGTPSDVEREVADALRQAGDRPLIIAPGCTYDAARVPHENLAALVRAARS